MGIYSGRDPGMTSFLRLSPTQMQFRRKITLCFVKPPLTIRKRASGIGDLTPDLPLTLR